jgi:hypothetical protein
VAKSVAAVPVLQQTAELKLVESDEARALFAAGYRAAAEAGVRPRAAGQRTMAKKNEAAGAADEAGPPGAAGALGLRYAWSGRTLTIESNTAGFLYLLQNAANGAWTTVAPGRIAVRQNVAVSLPVPPGGELAVVLSRSEVADPAATAKSPTARLVTSVAGSHHYVVAPAADLLVARIGAGPR